MRVGPAVATDGRLCPWDESLTLRPLFVKGIRDAGVSFMVGA